jgi:hydroxymethylbilane synthase
MTSERLHIRVATRASALALRQVEEVQEALECRGHSVEIVSVQTRGDADGRPFSQMEGQGFFTKAVQEVVLSGDADLAVHSYKDLPSAQVVGLEVAAVPHRADPRDVLLIRSEHFEPGAEHFPLKPFTRVGTGAARRRAQLLDLRADLELADMRGNVPTRIDKLRSGEVEAIVVAAAGLKRLGLDLFDVKLVVLHPRTFVPAPAQGALALEVRRGDDLLASILTDLHDPRGYRAVAAERGLLSMFQGGCQLALGAHATLEGGLVTLNAWYEGEYVVVEDPTPEGAAMLAYDAFGRPKPNLPNGAE